MDLLLLYSVITERQEHNLEQVINSEYCDVNILVHFFFLLAGMAVVFCCRSDCIIYSFNQYNMENILS